MKLWVTILTLLGLLASPIIHADDSADGQGATTDTSAGGNKTKGEHEEEPDCD